VIGRGRCRGGVWLLVWLAMAGCTRSGRTPEESAPPPSLVVSAARVVVAPLTVTVTLAGTTVAAERLIVRAPAAGFLSDLTVQPGDSVTRGQLLARLTTREDAAARAGARIAAHLDAADSAAVAQAVGRYATAPALPLSAPQGGVVAQRLASDGQFVNEFDPVVEMVNPASLAVEAEAPLGVLGALRVGQAVTLTSAALARPVAGRVAAILPSAAASSETVPVRIAVLGGARALAATGIAVQAVVVTAAVPDALVIPRAALFVNPADDTNYVFVAGADGRAHRRVIVTGLREATRVQVLRGLGAGELVITSGGYALSDGLAVRALVGR